MEKKRNINLDIIRIVAVFFVIFVHFFLNSEFYGQKMVGSSLLILNIIRVIPMTCVPLFLILSGYLCNKKEINKSYYSKIFPIIITYIIVSIACIIFAITQGKSYSFLQAILSIFDFSAAKYSWYVEMYIGLFLLIPFLNIIWNNIGSDKNKYILITTLVFLVSLPSLLNIFDINFSNGIKEFFIASKNQSKIIPSWWTGIYPIMYYYIGCFIHDFKDKIKIKNIHLFLIIVVLSIVFGFINYYRCNSNVWRYENYTYFAGGIENLVCSSLIFILFLKIKFNIKNKYALSIIGRVSKVSFCMYLISYIFDSLVYDRFNNYFNTFNERLLYMPIPIIIVFISSFLTSIVICYICDFICKIINKFLNV